MVTSQKYRRSIVIAVGVGVVVMAVLALAAGLASAMPSGEPFEITPGSFKVTPSTYQAGAHENLTVSFNFHHNNSEQTYNDLNTTVVNLPPGFVGSNTAVPTCTAAELLTPKAHKVLDKGTGGVFNPAGTECPPASQVGTISFNVNVGFAPGPAIFPLYNMEVTSPGVTAEFGFHALVLTQLLVVTVRPGDSGLTITSPNINEIAEPHEISVTTWGVPDARSHQAERGYECWTANVGEETCEDGNEEVNVTPKPYLTNPTSCGPTTATMKADSWEEPEKWSEASTEIAPIVECERVPFHPSIAVQPTTTLGGIPERPEHLAAGPADVGKTGIDIDANLKDTELTLPVGYTVNPSRGSGLGYLHAAAVRSRNVLFAARRRLPAGIEDRRRRSRNARPRRKAHGQRSTSPSRSTTSSTRCSPSISW